MDILNFYKRFLNATPETRKTMLTELKNYDIEGQFNWVDEVFEKLFGSESKKAVIYYNSEKEEENSLSYIDLIKNYNKFINLLRSYGFKKGTNIYVMLPAIPEQWYITIGALKAGFTIIPAAPNLTEYELKFRFSQNKPDVIISDISNSEKLDKAAPDGIFKLVAGRKKGWKSLDEIKNYSEIAEPEKLYKNDVFIKYFTSGTTGMPKAVIHSAVLYPLGQLSTLTGIGIMKDFIHVNLSSPGWAKFAWSSIFAPLSAGATVLSIYYGKRLNAHEYLKILEKYNVNSLCAPPTAWRQFIATHNDDIKLESIKETVSAGEPLNGEIINKWKAKYKTTIRDFYGQTESTAMVANISGSEVIPGSMGKPLGICTIKLLDENMEVINEPNTIGDIAVENYKNNYGLLLGYSDDVKNKEVFKNNYYLTGDRAYFDDNGYFYFVSRTDDVIKTSDYRVGPFEVESAIIKNQNVLESAVVGRPDKIKYQTIKAYVVLKPEAVKNLDTAIAIENDVKDILPRYKWPEFIEFVDELPKTISGKIKRNELREIEVEKSENNVIGDYEFTVK